MKKLLLLVLLLSCLGCGGETAPKPKPRFVKVRDIKFTDDGNDASTAAIYRDTETQIEYLYIWSGAANGGPAITRLWPKER